MLATVAITLLLISSFVLPNTLDAFAVEPCESSIVNLQDTNYRGPVFLDSYWTDLSASSTSTGTPLKKEVGPQEGPSTFAVVLVNRSPNDIINVQGVLNLPPGYVVAGTSGDPSTQNIFKTILRTGVTNPAVASYDATVPAGATFTLYFDIDVLDNAKVGLNTSQLVVNYYLAGDFQYCNSALLTVPFLLPGKVVLDAVSNTPNLIPNQENTLSISLINKGSADATGVVASIVSLGETNSKGSSSSSSSLVLQSSTTQLVNLGPNMFNIGTIPAHGKTTITTTIFPSSTTSGTIQNAQLQLFYGNAYGYKLSSVISTGLVVSPDITTSALNISYADKNSSPLLTAGKLEDLHFTVTNNGTSTLTNVVISLTPPSSSLSVVGDSKWTIQTLKPGDTQELSTKVFAGTNMISTPASFSVAANYVSDGVAKTDTLNLGAYVIGDINIQVNDLSVNYVGNEANLVGNLLNQGSTTGLFTSIQLLHPEKLLNGTGFNGTRNGGGGRIFGAAPGAQGETTQGQFGQDQSNQQFGQGQSGQGQFGQGQGNQGRFSFRNNASASATPQYLGDLTANSPTPFSIPLSGSINRGTYPVSFKVTYADDLKQFHQVTLNGTLHVQQLSTSTDNTRRSAGFGGVGMMFFYLPITGASAAAATFFVMKKRKSSTKMVEKNKDIDLESLLDDSAKK